MTKPTQGPSSQEFVDDVHLPKVIRSPGQNYTSVQIEQYFDRIKLPQKWRNLKDSKSLEFLRALQTHQISSVPFENLSLHYSPHKEIKIDPESVFKKIVESNRGRGGYCMESNVLFLGVLRTLGYEVFPTGARVNSSFQPNGEPGDAGKYLGLNHMVNIVTVASRAYLVDVAFGTNGCHHPLSLSPNDEGCKQQLHRIQRRQISDFTTNQENYVYEFSVEPPNTPEKEISWTPAYCFNLVEFCAADYEIMNYSSSTNPASFFTKSILCVKINVKDGHLKGDISVLENVVMYREMKDGKLITTKALTMTSERHRLDVFAEMGIQLTDQERNGIKGTNLEIMTQWKKMRSMSFEV